MDKKKKNSSDDAEDDKFPLEPKRKPEKTEKQVQLGKGDVKPLAGGKIDPESGMYMGPNHPYFRKSPAHHPDVDAASTSNQDTPGDNGPRPYPYPEKKLPQDAQTPAARFAAITPFGKEFSGEPETD